jgi:hypothetical protein
MQAANMENTRAMVLSTFAYGPMIWVFEMLRSLLFGGDGVAMVIAMQALKLVGIRMFEVDDSCVINVILQTFRPNSVKMNNNRQGGYLWCRDFIGYCSRDSNGISHLVVIMNEIKFHAATAHLYTFNNHVILPSERPETDGDVHGSVDQSIEMLRTSRGSDFDIFTFALRMTPTRDQERAVNAMRRVLNRMGRCVAFVEGPPGTGKSTLASLLTASLGPCVCVSGLGFFDESTNLLAIMAKRYQLYKKYAVVAFDEVDAGIDAGIFATDSEKPLEAEKNKRKWNGFFDDVAVGMYPNAVVILTSNTSHDQISAVDASLLRGGRVNIVIKMHTPISDDVDATRLEMIEMDQPQ